MRIILLLLCCFFTTIVTAQSKADFFFLNKRKVQIIPFQLINNLIVIPVTVNGQQLSFLLDTGVGMTLLFNNSSVAKIYFKERNSFNLIGLGQGEATKAYLTRGNTLQIGKIRGLAQEVLLVEENNYIFSRRMGTQIDGIIGHEFFKNFPITIDYGNKKIKVYRDVGFFPIPTKAVSYPLIFYRNKPHIELEFSLRDSLAMKAPLLIDTGSSDALWLFEAEGTIEKTAPLFEDFLGRAINGDIFGERGKIKSIHMGRHTLKNVKVAYPEMDNFKAIDVLSGRIGSLGGELLSRFTLYLDYPNQRMAVKASKRIKDPFYYNMSGISLQYNGVELVPRKRNNSNNIVYNESGANRGIEIFLRDVIRYELQDIIEVAEVRANSPAAIAGIQKGDVLSRINNRRLDDLKLHEIAGLLQRKPGKKIKLLVRRGDSFHTKTFVLKPLFNSTSDF
ncbi:MAG: aspartyl protease family protein [Flavobacteriaceae bacterium]